MWDDLSAHGEHSSHDVARRRAAAVRTLMYYCCKHGRAATRLGEEPKDAVLQRQYIARSGSEAHRTAFINGASSNTRHTHRIDLGHDLGWPPT